MGGLFVPTKPLGSVWAGGAGNVQSPGGHGHAQAWIGRRGQSRVSSGRSFRQRRHPARRTQLGGRISRVGRHEMHAHHNGLIPLSKITSLILSRSYFPAQSAVRSVVRRTPSSGTASTRASPKIDPGLPHLAQALVLQGVPYHPLGAAQFSLYAFAITCWASSSKSSWRALRGRRLVA